MRSRDHLSRLALLVAASCSSASQPAPGPGPGKEDPVERPYVLSLVVNHDGAQRALRGWPLVLRISATLDREPARAYTVDDASVALVVRDAAGGVETWPLERPVDASGGVLDAGHPSVEVVRVMPAGATAALLPGPRTVELAWGSARRTFAITVEDPPADSAEVRESRAMLEADEALARGQMDAAIAALDAQFALAPDSIALLNQRALIQERKGDAPAAFADAQRALSAFAAQVPDPEEPPITLLSIIERLGDRVLGGGE